MVTYSPCHYLEGIKNVLSECSGMVRTVELCAQIYDGHGAEDAFQVPRHKVPGAMLSEPPSLSQSERRGILFSVIPVLIVR